MEQKLTKEEVKRRYLDRYNARRRMRYAENKKNEDFLKKQASVSRRFYHHNSDYRQRRLSQLCDKYRQSLLDPCHNLIQQ